MVRAMLPLQLGHWRRNLPFLVFFTGFGLVPVGVVTHVGDDDDDVDDTDDADDEDTKPGDSLPMPMDVLTRCVTHCLHMLKPHAVGQIRG